MKKQKPVNRNYRFWWDTAFTARFHQQTRGKQYQDGVEREAALAAMDVQHLGLDSAIDAIEEVFVRFVKAPQSRWDGSIA